MALHLPTEWEANRLIYTMLILFNYVLSFYDIVIVLALEVLMILVFANLPFLAAIIVEQIEETTEILANNQLITKMEVRKRFSLIIEQQLEFDGWKKK